MVRDGLPALVIAGVALSWATPCRAQEERWHLDANLADEALGLDLAWIGDVDGDGLADFAAGVEIQRTDFDRDNPFERDRVRLLSGRDGATLGELVDAHESRFGCALAACSDHDGDGVADLIVAQRDDGAGKGKATIWSSRAGTQLGVVTTPGLDDWLGVALDTLPDSDGDALQEFVIGLPQADFGSGRVGAVQIRSSRDGALLAEWRGSQQRGFGGSETFAVVPDLDRDGDDDLVMVEWTLLTDGRHQFDVRGISGRTRAQLFLSTFISADGVPGSLCGGGDRNLDGWNDFAFVRNYSNSSGPLHELRIHSGKTGAGLIAVNALRGESSDLAATGDLDGDGHPDVALGVHVPQDSENRLVVRSTKKAGLPVIDEITETFFFLDSGRRFRLPRSRPRDVDGDGFTDLLHSSVSIWSIGYFPSRVAVRSPATDAELLRSDSEEALRDFANAIVTGDLDDDGVNDLLVHEVGHSVGIEPSDLVARSGADGSEIYRVRDVAEVDPCPLVALPDLDGDDVPDFAAVNALDGIDVRSGRDGSLLAQHESFLGLGNTAGMAVIVDPKSHGGPRRHRLALVDGRSASIPLVMLDLSTGARIWSIASTIEHRGSNVVALGDVDGDGIGDLARDAPSIAYGSNTHGRVVLLSGADGHEIAEVRATTGQTLGGALAAAEDQDGDGVAELLVGSLNDKPLGSMSLHRGTDLTELRRWSATVPFGHSFGAQIAVVHDSNGDGSEELLTSIKYGEWLECYSASSTRQLATLLPKRRIASGTQLRTAAPWIRPDDHGDARRTLVTVNLPADGLYVWTLPPLHLTLTPASVAPDETITADVRGGPERSPMLLRLVAIDDVALDVVLVADALDGHGEWTISDTAPPGLSGTTLAFRAATIGFDGRLAQSSVQELLFE